MSRRSPSSSLLSSLLPSCFALNTPSFLERRCFLFRFVCVSPLTFFSLLSLVFFVVATTFSHTITHSFICSRTQDLFPRFFFIREYFPFPTSSRFPRILPPLSNLALCSSSYCCFASSLHRQCVLVRRPQLSPLFLFSVHLIFTILALDVSVQTVSSPSSIPPSFCRSSYAYWHTSEFFAAPHLL